MLGQFLKEKGIYEAYKYNTADDRRFNELIEMKTQFCFLNGFIFSMSPEGKDYWVKHFHEWERWIESKL